SVSLHAAVLAWRAADPPAPEPVRQTLDVTLVNTQTKLAPLDPDVLAQDNLLGGGDHDRGQSATTLPRTAETSTGEIVLPALKERQKELEQSQQRLLLQATSAKHVPAEREGSDTTQPSTTDTAEDARDQESLIVSSQIARIRDRIERYNARPRETYIGPSARSDAQARYLEVWRNRIESLGTEHYPDDARGRIYGSLQLTAYIGRDGQLIRIEIDRPSEHAVLNQAAQRIV